MGYLEEIEQSLELLEEEYGVAPSREEEKEEGLFGQKGFLGNIKDYYQTESWGDWWRGLLGRGKKKKESAYTVYPEWGSENIRTLQDIMKETE